MKHLASNLQESLLCHLTVWFYIQVNKVEYFIDVGICKKKQDRFHALLQGTTQVVLFQLPALFQVAVPAKQIPGKEQDCLQYHAE